MSPVISLSLIIHEMHPLQLGLALLGSGAHLGQPSEAGVVEITQSLATRQAGQTLGGGRGGRAETPQMPAASFCETAAAL